MKLGKRGDYEVYFFIFTLIMTAIVVVALVGFQKKLGDSGTLDVAYLARDLALFIDAAYAAPGSLFAGYTIQARDFSISDFIYKFHQNSVEVARSSQTPGSEYTYASNAQFRFIPSNFDNPKIINIKNDGIDVENNEFMFSIGPDVTNDLHSLKFHSSAVKSATNIATELKDTSLPFLSLIEGLERPIQGDIDIYVRIEPAGDNTELLIAEATAAKSRKLAAIMTAMIQQRGGSVAISITDDSQANQAKEAGIIIKISEKYIIPGLIQKAVVQYKK